MQNKTLKMIKEKPRLTRNLELHERSGIELARFDARLVALKRFMKFCAINLQKENFKAADNL